MTKISELGLCKNECCADKIRAAMKAGTAYGRATPTLSAAMELPDVRAGIESLDYMIRAYDFLNTRRDAQHDALMAVVESGSSVTSVSDARAALAQLKETKP